MAFIYRRFLTRAYSLVFVRVFGTCKRRLIKSNIDLRSRATAVWNISLFYIHSSSTIHSPPKVLAVFLL